MPRLSQKALRSAVYHALAAHAAKERDRGQLIDGESYPLEISIEASCGAQAMVAEIVGDLTVGHATSSASSSGCDVAQVCAYMISQLPNAKQIQILDDLPARFELNGQLPVVADDLIEAAARMHKRLRHRTTLEKKGQVSFRPAMKAAA